MESSQSSSLFTKPLGCEQERYTRCCTVAITVCVNIQSGIDRGGFVYGTITIIVDPVTSRPLGAVATSKSSQSLFQVSRWLNTGLCFDSITVTIPIRVHIPVQGLTGLSSTTPLQS